MFSDNKKEKQNLETTSNQNIISQGTKIVGDIMSEGDLRIDGTVEGNLKTTGKVVVGKSGFIKGTLNGSDAYFEGKFSGKLNLTDTLTLKSSAHIEGEVILGKLSVEPGATFNVTCVMKGSVKEFNKGVQQHNNNNKDQKGQNQKDRLNSYAQFTGMGFQMLVTIGLGVLAGVKLDEKYPNQYSTFTIICSLASIGLALYSVIKQVSKFSNKKNTTK